MSPDNYSSKSCQSANVGAQGQFWREELWLHWPCRAIGLAQGLPLHWRNCPYFRGIVNKLATCSVHEKNYGYTGPAGPSGWHKACPYTGGIARTLEASLISWQRVAFTRKSIVTLALTGQRAGTKATGRRAQLGRSSSLACYRRDARMGLPLHWQNCTIHRNWLSMRCLRKK